MSFDLEPSMETMINENILSMNNIRNDCVNDDDIMCYRKLKYFIKEQQYFTRLDIWGSRDKRLYIIFFFLFEL